MPAKTGSDYCRDREAGGEEIGGRRKAEGGRRKAEGQGAESGVE